MNKITVALIVLLTACIAGGGVYFWKQAELDEAHEMLQEATDELNEAWVELEATSESESPKTKELE